GPMLVCLDTSGSMRGAPENVAKACVLQALRTAHASGRACRLLAFGGSGELLEQELALTPQGLDTLLALMDQSFDGGTDVQTPLERAIARVQEEAFALADIL
ncbi:MAG: VWA domain-containing protein, partial [Rhodoferax sp.]|nr:VWA domain-containing protein [Rhodoferax sp.]